MNVMMIPSNNGRGQLWYGNKEYNSRISCVKWKWHGLGLKCQTPLRLNHWVEEMEVVFFYSDEKFEPENTFFFTQNSLDPVFFVYQGWSFNTYPKIQ